MPYRPAVHPALREESVPLWDWVDGHRLLRSAAAREQHVERTRPELMVARCFPAAHPDWFGLLCRWLAWAFIVDDELDDGPAGRDAARCRGAIEGLLAAVEGNPDPGNGFAVALAELWERTTRGRSGGWRLRFEVNLRDWLWSYHTETVQRSREEFPAIPEYLAHRRHTVGTLWCVDLMEAALGIELPAAVHQLPEFGALCGAAAEHIGLFNDVLSGEKERRLGYTHNSVLLHEKHSGMSTSEAVEAVNVLLTERIEMLDASARILLDHLETAGFGEPVRAETRTGIAGLRALVRGNFDWHFEVGRYRAPEALVQGRPGYVDELFAATSPSGARPFSPR